MTKIAVDIDDTLYDFNTVARDAFMQLAHENGEKETFFKGAYAAWPEWRSPADVCGQENWLRAIDIVHQPEVIARQRPFPGAVETLNELASQGLTVKYISNRSSEASEATVQWIKDHGFPHGELVCTDGPKIPHLKDCQFLVDDRPRTLVEFVYDHNWHRDKNSHGVMPRLAFGIWTDYNRNLTDIRNIYLAPTWNGIAYYMRRKGVLKERKVINA